MALLLRWRVVTAQRFGLKSCAPLTGRCSLCTIGHPSPDKVIRECICLFWSYYSSAIMWRLEGVHAELSLTRYCVQVVSEERVDHVGLLDATGQAIPVTRIVLGTFSRKVGQPGFR